MRVYLTGFMGSGKSTLGKSLATALSYRFIDLDSLIEEEEGLAISEIFASKGEKEFRAIETAVLQSLSADDCVIALGGGTPCSDTNIDYIKSSGISFYLYLSEEDLFTRLSKLRNGNRPLIDGLDDDALDNLIRSKLEERKSFYMQADYTIDGSQAIDDLVKLIRNQLK